MGPVASSLVQHPFSASYILEPSQNITLTFMSPISDFSYSHLNISFMGAWLQPIHSTFQHAVGVPCVVIEL